LATAKTLAVKSKYIICNDAPFRAKMQRYSAPQSATSLALNNG